LQKRKITKRQRSSRSKIHLALGCEAGHLRVEGSLHLGQLVRRKFVSMLTSLLGLGPLGLLDLFSSLSLLQSLLAGLSVLHTVPKLRKGTSLHLGGGRATCIATRY
jgi:hypothetical protein